MHRQPVAVPSPPAPERTSQTGGKPHDGSVPKSGLAIKTPSLFSIREIMARASSFNCLAWTADGRALLTGVAQLGSALSNLQSAQMPFGFNRPSRSAVLRLISSISKLPESTIPRFLHA